MQLQKFAGDSFVTLFFSPFANETFITEKRRKFVRCLHAFDFFPIDIYRPIFLHILYRGPHLLWTPLNPDIAVFRTSRADSS